MKLLIATSVAIDGRNKHGATPLYDAIVCNQQRHVELLVNAGAPLNFIDSAGHSTMFFAQYAAPRRDDDDDDMYRVLFRAHCAQTTYALARILIAGARCAGQDTTLTRVLADYRHVVHVCVGLIQRTQTPLHWPRKQSTQYVLETIARLAIYHGSTRGGAVDAPSLTHARKAVMRIVNATTTTAAAAAAAAVPQP